MKQRKKYVENSDLIEELERFHKNDIISIELHEMFFLMSTKISLKAMYKDKPYRDDLIHSAYIKCIKKAHMFDLNKKNPFAYFQSIIENLFKDHIYKHEKDKRFVAKLSIKVHSEIANEYNLYPEIEELILDSEPEIGSFNTIYWNKAFIDFLKMPYIDINLQINNYFINDMATKLLETENSEIIYLNTICDNKNGHCICEKCNHLQFDNIYGKLIMKHRQVLMDMKGLE